MTEFKEALSESPRPGNFEIKNSGSKFYGIRNEDIVQWYFEHKEVIHRALNIADKIMQEPSEEIVDIGAWAIGIHNLDNCQTADAVFKAMRDVMLKEVGDD